MQEHSFDGLFSVNLRVKTLIIGLRIPEITFHTKGLLYKHHYAHQALCVCVHVCLSCGMHNCVFPEEQIDKVCQTFRDLAIDLPIDYHLPFVHVLSLAELEKCVSGCSCLKTSSILTSHFEGIFSTLLDSFMFAFSGLFPK